jgi:hypothetical protein
VAATTTTSTVAATTTTTLGPEQLQPENVEEALRVLDALPAVEESPPFDPTLAADIDRALATIIADPTVTPDFFVAVADKRPIGVIAAPYLICDPDKGGGRCTASIEDYRTSMEVCSRPGSLLVRRVVATEQGWAAAGTCSFVIEADHVARAATLMLQVMEGSGTLLTEDPELVQLAGEWAAHRVTVREPIEAPTSSQGQAFVARLRTISGLSNGRCGNLGVWATRSTSAGST